MTKNVPSKNTEKNTKDNDPAQDHLRELIARQIGEVTSGSDRKMVVERVYSLMVSERFSGPLPMPRHLAEYESIHPGLAERIVKMAEENHDHQQECDRKIIDADIADRRVGLYGGMAVFVALVLIAFIFAFQGNVIAAGLFLAPAVLGVLKHLFRRNGS